MAKELHKKLERQSKSMGKMPEKADQKFKPLTVLPLPVTPFDKQENTSNNQYKKPNTNA